MWQPTILLLATMSCCVNSRSYQTSDSLNSQIEETNNNHVVEERITNEIVEPTVFDSTTNSSFGFSIPLFSITVPGYGREHPEIDQFRTVNIGNLALLGMATLGTISVTYPLVATRINQLADLFSTAQRLKRDLTNHPSGIDLLKVANMAASILIPETESEMHGSRVKRSSHRSSSRTLNMNRGMAGFTEYVMKSVDKSLEKFPNIPSLDPQECMKRSVCEAHNQPDKYGLVGLLLQLLFPPYLNGDADVEEPLSNQLPDDASPVISKYQQAARYGRRNDAECGRQYDGCIISLLEVSQKIINYFIK